jgi:hypothetical protein
MQVVPATPGYILALIVVFGAFIFLSFLSRNRNKQRTRNQKPPKGPAQREDNSAPASKLPDENNGETHEVIDAADPEKQN